MELLAAIAGALIGTSLSPEMWVAVGLVVAFATTPINFVRALLIAALLLVGLRAVVLGNLQFFPATLAALAVWSSLGWGLRVLLAGTAKPAAAASTPPSLAGIAKPASGASTPPDSSPVRPREAFRRAALAIKAIPYIVSILVAACLGVTIYFTVAIHQTVVLLKAAYLADKAAQVLPDCIKAAKAAGFDANPFSLSSPTVALAVEYVDLDSKDARPVSDLKLIWDDLSASAEASVFYLVFLLDIGDRTQKGFCSHRLISGKTEFVSPDRVNLRGSFWR